MDGIIRRLRENEKIPFDLLLLADETLTAINKYINDSEIYVYEKDKRIIAVYVLQLIDKETTEIKNIAVDVEYQGRGIGTKLLNDAAERAKEKGFTSVVICTGDVGYRQLKLYQREGFKIFDVKKDFFINNYPEPIFENGLQLKDMIMLKKEL